MDSSRMKRFEHFPHFDFDDCGQQIRQTANIIYALHTERIAVLTSAWIMQHTICRLSQIKMVWIHMTWYFRSIMPVCTSWTSDIIHTAHLHSLSTLKRCEINPQMIHQPECIIFWAIFQKLSDALVIPFALFPPLLLTFNGILQAESPEKTTVSFRPIIIFLICVILSCRRCFLPFSLLFVHFCLSLCWLNSYIVHCNFAKVRQLKLWYM